MDRFGVAVETGSPEMQKRINKNINFNKVREIVKIMKSRHIHVHINWMVGFPNETIEQINSTFDFARELKAHTNQFWIVLPYPGTQLFEEAKSANLLVFQEDDLDRFDNRKGDFLKSNEWDFAKLQDMTYDVNIEVNFINNPLLDTEEGMNYMLGFFKELLLMLPEHIIARIIVGYIYKKMGNLEEYKRCYDVASDLLKREAIGNTFSKYLSKDHHIINDFNRYQKTKVLTQEKISSTF